MAITLVEIVQLTVELVARAERAEQRVKELEAEVSALQSGAQRRACDFVMINADDM